MNSSKPAYPALQRHRRKSNPASPTSPIFGRRAPDRTNRAYDGSSPGEGLSANTGTSDSPSPDVTGPSPNLRLPPFSHFPQDTHQASFDHRRTSRLSEEDARPKPRFPVDMMRPATSDAVEALNGIENSLRGLNLMDTASKSSPLASHYKYGEYQARNSYEAQGRHSDSPSPNLRNYSISSQTAERGFQDEPSQKAGHTKKSRLNLLNPMSLLARRRSAQHQNDGANLTIKTLSVPALPDNFDPSIRGTITHDFSAPRSRRTPSYGDVNNYDQPPRKDSLQQIRDASQLSDNSNHKLQPPAVNASGHSPVFTEHFQDDRQTLRPDRTQYLHSIATSNSADTSNLAANMPAFAKRLPVRLPSAAEAGKLLRGSEVLDLDRPLPKEPPETPPAPSKRVPSSSLDVSKPHAMPKHMKSTSSRFSFQLGGPDSSVQERLLEEKHKEQRATKEPSSVVHPEELDEDNYDDYDYDFDADNGLEEKIPGVNTDFAEDDNNGALSYPLYGASGAHAALHEPLPGIHSAAQKQYLQGFHFTPQTMTFSPTSTNYASQPTPRDDDGFAIGVADTRDSPRYMSKNIDQHPSSGYDGTDISFYDGLGIVASKPPSVGLPHHPQRLSGGFDDTDLYFDDGGFDDHYEELGDDAFDEAIFDDETGQIHDIPAENAKKLQAAIQAASKPGEFRITQDTHQRTGEPAGHNVYARTQTSFPDEDGSKAVTGLTEGNLAAYHDALAMAANQAAANGKFSRNVSFHTSSEDDTSQSQLESSQPGLISDESRLSHNFDSSGIAEDDGFPFDDDMDDELMIAEANAEALENDDEGFYGQEFGFYARAHGKGGSEMVNGGFFSSRGSNGVKRSHSAKANFQEPSLTPITERSEWSTRNSVASLQIPGGIPGSAQSIPSPGIAQLLELDSPGYEDDMTFSALRKLRRGAFGDNASSISSPSQGHPGSSPLAHLSHNSFSAQDHHHGHSRMASSAHSMTASIGIPESEEEDEEWADRPTVTQNTPRKKRSDPSPTTPQDRNNSSPLAGMGERKTSHSRNSSGSESVSYARDSDGRWVLERRRTGEDGGLEVVDREYLAGAHI